MLYMYIEYSFSKLIIKLKINSYFNLNLSFEKKQQIRMACSGYDFELISMSWLVFPKISTSVSANAYAVYLTSE